MTKAKKTFKDVVIQQSKSNPAEAFITTPAEKERKERTAKEKKSVRINLLFKPSVKNNIEKLATMKRTSVNDLIGIVLEEYIAENEEVIRLHDRIFEGE